jgi:hypothetical protein
MTDPTVPPADDAAKRAAFVADLLALATLLTVNPWAPVPVWAEVSEHLNDSTRPETVVPALDKLRDLAARLGVEVDEHLNDRSQVVARFGSINYKLIAWHPAGRPGELDAREAELERLRAEVAELRAAATKPSVNLGAFGYSRDADDPTPVSPARVPLHTGGVVDGGQLVDETPVDRVVFRRQDGTEVDVTETPEESAAIVDQNLRAMGSVGLVDESDVADARAELAAHIRAARVAANTVPVAAEDATLTRLPESEGEAR